MDSLCYNVDGATASKIACCCVFQNRTQCSRDWDLRDNNYELSRQLRLMDSLSYNVDDTTSNKIAR